MSRELDLVVMTDMFPELSETFVLAEALALREAGHRVRVESGMRSQNPNPDGTAGLDVSYLDTEGLLRRLSALAWLLARHPLRCAGDRFARRRWRREEDVRSLASLATGARRLARGGERIVHVHFAGPAALDALRLSRLLGIGYSLTTHAYDIYKRPRNLTEKLEGAALVTTVCRYNVEYLRGLVSPGRAERIHVVGMGVDPRRFSRRRPYPESRTVLAVGRLIEKKGFEHLVGAAARLADRGLLERVTIVGEGPLHGDLEQQVRELGLGAVVELAGSRSPGEVRELLEDAALLAMPCVVARDGDRDGMPVVVKEAMAMEVPVVASDEVGLPEYVRDDWGRLVPPGDEEALAAAIAELLALPREQRMLMGRAGRAWIVKHGAVAQEAEKLGRLLAATVGP